MATESNNLLISETGINSNAKSISNMTSFIKSCSSNILDLSLKVGDLSLDVIDLTNHFNDLSSKIYDFSSDVSKMASGLSGVTTDFDIMSIDINSLSSELTGLSSDFTKLTNNMTNMPIDSSVFSETDSALSKMSSSTAQMNNELNDTNTSTEEASSGFGKLIKSALSFDNIQKGTDMVDQYINASNKLADVNDGMQTQMDLQNKVNAAADRSCESYNDMANAVSSIGSLDTFKKDNDSAIGFTELIQKSLKIDQSDQSLSDVTKSMSDGSLQGEEFSSIAGKDSTIGNALSGFTGKSNEQLQEMADQGLITANLLKNAMFAAGQDINTEFENQPKTFADIWTKITNSAMNAFSPLIQLVSDILNSPAIQAGINIIISSLGLVSQVISNLIGLITNNWTTILPILIAIGLYLAYIGGTALVGVITSLWATVAAEMAAIAPFLIIIGIIAAVIYVLQSLGVSFEDIFGFIGGVVGVAIAGIWNLFLGLFDLILGIISYLANPFINFANFFGNLFTNPISSIIYLFQGMADNVLGVLETVASAMDKVFGTNMAKTVSGWRSGLKDMADSAVEKYAPDENYQKIVDNLSLSSDDFGLRRMDYGGAIDAGTDMGKSLYAGVSGVVSSSSASDKGYDYSQFDTTNDTLGTSNNPVNVKGTGSGGAVDVNMEDEDLGYLRDMAERDYISNVATNTLAPNISVSFGDVHETADVNQLFGSIQTILRQQIAIAPEGVY